MRKSAAFFDVDETLITIKSMFDFYAFWCRETNEMKKLERYMANFKEEVKKGTPREHLNREYYRQFSGIRYKKLEEAGERWFRSKSDADLFINSAVAALKQHQEEKRLTVFVSGSMHPVLAPIARYLGVTEIICAPLQLTGMGRVTGEIGAPQTIGEGKREALIAFCLKNEIDPADCYAYGDDLSDISMLESVGHPVCVGTNSPLTNYATRQHWPVI